MVENGKETITYINDDIPYNIPSNWSWTKFEDVAEISRGGSPRPITSFITDSTNGVNWIKIGDAEKGGKYIYTTKEKIKKEGIRHSKYVESGDFLLSNSMSFGRPYILKTDGCIHDGWLSIKFNKNVLNEDFLYNLLSSKFMYFQFESLAVGSTVKNLKSDSVKIAKIPIPPLEEQKRIVEAIENLTNKISSIDEEYSSIEEKISLAKSKLLDLAIRGKLLPQDKNDEPASKLLERIRKEKESAQLTSKGKRKTAVSYIFKGEDNLYYEQIGSEIKCIQDEIPFDIPNSWAWTRFCDVVDFKIGKTPDRNNDDYWCTGEYPWISISDMNSNSHIYKTKETISEKAFKTVFKENISPVGTLIMSFKLTVGKVSILAIDAIHNEAIISIFPRYSMGNIFRNYLFHILPIISQTGDSHDAIKGVTLNSKSLAKLLLPLPPLREQERISEFLTSAFTKLDLLAQH